MAVGDIITAVRYNNIQSTIEDVLGVGSANFGYGGNTASNQVPVEKIVTASDMNNLFTDLDRIYRHQVNLGPGASIATLAVEDLIADDDNEPSDILKGYADYEAFTTSIANDPNRFRLHATQSTTDDEVQNLTFSSSWQTSLNGYYRATFTSANARRYFFNAGGRITFKVNLVSTASGGNVAKTNDWATMLSNSGTVSFGHNYTSSDNSGTGSSIGNYQLTNSEQQLYRKSGSGVYADNNYYVRGRNISSTVIEFRILMDEADTGNTSGAKGVQPVDEFVQGNLTHHIGYVTASGSYVAVAAPTITRQSNFSGS